MYIIIIIIINNKVNTKELDKKKLYKPPKIVMQKNPLLNRPSEYKPPGELVLGICPECKVKQSKNG